MPPLMGTPLRGGMQTGTSAPRGNFRHQANCCHPPHRRTQAQAAVQHSPAVRSHPEGAYGLMQQAIQPAGVVEPDPSSLLLRPSANRSCRRPSDPRFRDPCQDGLLHQAFAQVACQQHHPPTGGRFQATDPIADHQHPDCAAPDCAAAVENVHPSPDLNDDAAAANAPFANRSTQSTPRQLLGPKETNPSQS